MWQVLDISSIESELRSLGKGCVQISSKTLVYLGLKITVRAVLGSLHFGSVR